MNHIQTLRLKQTLHSVQAEHMLDNLSMYLNRSRRGNRYLVAEVKRQIHDQLDQALAVAKAILMAEHVDAMSRMALADAMRADPSKGTPEHFCWIGK